MRQRYFVRILAVLLIIGFGVAFENYFGTQVFVATNGNVTFNHRVHTIRQNFACWTCHTKPFPPWRGALTYTNILHKVAEADKGSCGQCHRPGGEAFESRGNCTKCHEKPVVDPGGTSGSRGSLS
jgi:c(7)-type cytochrome triheme protein